MELAGLTSVPSQASTGLRALQCFYTELSHVELGFNLSRHRTDRGCARVLWHRRGGSQHSVDSLRRRIDPGDRILHPGPGTQALRRPRSFRLAGPPFPEGRAEPGVWPGPHLGPNSPAAVADKCAVVLFLRLLAGTPRPPVAPPRSFCQPRSTSTMPVSFSRRLQFLPRASGEVRAFPDRDVRTPGPREIT